VSTRLIRKTIKARAVHSANVDLIPFMCLLMILIPPLLTGIVFERLASVQARLPEASTLAPEPGQESKEPSGIVELRLAIRDDGLDLEATLSHDAHGKEKENYEDVRYSLPLEGDQYSLAEMQRILKNLKHDYPRHEQIVFLIEDGVTYEVIVHAMDAAREEIYEENGQKLTRSLFPAISLSEPFKEDGVFEGLRKGTREIDQKLRIE